MDAAERQLFDDDREQFKCSCFAVYLLTILIITTSVAPGALFIYFILYPESKACWTNDSKQIATPKRTLRIDDDEMDMAPLFSFWTWSGLIFNILLTASNFRALCVPMRRKDLTYLG